MISAEGMKKKTVFKLNVILCSWNKKKIIIRMLFLLDIFCVLFVYK